MLTLRYLVVGAGVLLASACTPSGVVVAPWGSHRLTAVDETTGLTAVLTTGV
ncbi:MAG: hypothetical protein JKY37_04760, partial [Nannocystaceae bacterium]|nr:hypothetical protein [Nannocystaceae bacterium]